MNLFQQLYKKELSGIFEYDFVGKENANMYLKTETMYIKLNS